MSLSFQNESSNNSGYNVYGNDISFNSNSTNKNSSSAININKEKLYIDELKKSIDDSYVLETNMTNHINKTRTKNIFITFLVILFIVAANNQSLSFFKLVLLSGLTTLFFYFMANLLVKPVLKSKSLLETLVEIRKFTQGHLEDLEKYVAEIERLNKENNELHNVITYLDEYSRFLGGSSEKEDEFISSFKEQ